MRDTLVLTVGAMILISFTIGAGGFAPITQLHCHEVEGTVIGKDMSDGVLKIYATINDGGTTQNYIVYVGPETYENYHIGDAYTEKFCEFESYEQFQQILHDLIELGVFEDLNS
jgi:hypothetical protein